MSGLRIGIPSISKAEAPKIFLSRLVESMQRQRLAVAVPFWMPVYDIGLFVTRSRFSFGKPFALRLDGIAFDSRETKGPRRSVNEPIIRSISRASGVICQSEFNRRQVEAFFGEFKVPCRIIPNGVDLRCFSPVGANRRAQLGIGDNEPVLLTSAAWRAHKRLGDVIEVYKQLKKSINNIHLVVIGKTDGSVETVEGVHYTGFIAPSELPSWYRIGDVYLFLSWIDHCPNTVVEAIACGLPVVCTNLGGTREIVERAQGGIVAEADEPYDWGLVDLYNPPKPDYKSITDAVLYLLENKIKIKERIDFSQVDIDPIARMYHEFLSSFVELA